ncbi:MAG: NACHT domain-containing protein [Phycisphaeraceae bacterium]
MLSEADIPTVVAEIAKAYITDIAGAIKRFALSATTTVKVRLNSTFEKYLTDIASKYSRAKTFVHRDTPQYLYSFYVPLDLKLNNELICDPGASELFFISKRVVITGVGGSGKSTFLRHLLLDCFNSKLGVPVFVELRNLRQSEYNLMDYIVDQLGLHELAASAEFIDKAFATGRFIFFLDGFDELPVEHRGVVSDQILEFTERYPNNRYLVSTRAEEICQSWNSFFTFHAAPLTLEKACLVINRLKYDPDVSRRFIADLEKGMFKKHKSFMSNPLLLTIMLITYRDNAEIPDRLHNFYSQAFDALFATHDALKEGGLRRTKESGLANDEFRSFFAAFCVMSYADRKFRFTRTEFAQYVNDARRISGRNVDTDKFLSDLTQALCMLVAEGLEYTFAHRSFQEYFAALFISECDDIETQRALIWDFATTSREDDVITLLHGMNPLLVERLLVIPWIESMKKDVAFNPSDIDASYTRFFPLIVSHFRLDESRSYAIPLVSLGPDVERKRRVGLLFFVHKVYQGCTIRVIDTYSFQALRTTTSIKCDRDDKMSAEWRVFAVDAVKDPLVLKELMDDFVFGADSMTWLFGLGDRLRQRHQELKTSVAEILIQRRLHVDND